MKTAEIVRRYLDSFSRGDLQELEGVLTEDLRFRGPLLKCDSREDYLEALKRDPPAPSECEVLEMVGDGDRAACIYTYGPNRLEVAQFFRLRDGRICETRLFFDLSAMAG